MHNNTGYCKYARRETGCKYFHPLETCQTEICNEKARERRHPKKCILQEKCSYQTICLYGHTQRKQKTNFDQDTETSFLRKQMKAIKLQIYQLKEDFSTLKQGSDKNITNLTQVHVQESNQVAAELANIKQRFI